MSWLLEGFRLASFPLNLPLSPASLISGVIAGTLLMAWLFATPNGRIDLRELWTRLVYPPLGKRVGAWLLLGGVYVLVRLLAGWVDTQLQVRFDTLQLGLIHPNPWLRMEGVLGRTSLPAGGPGVVLFVLVLWFRGLLLVAPLIPISRALRGHFGQLMMVHTLLIFTLAEFAPLMVDQPYPSGGWLVARTIVGLARAAIMGAAVAWAFGLAPLAPAAVTESDDLTPKDFAQNAPGANRE